MARRDAKYFLSDHLPLKQGLKPLNGLDATFPTLLSDHLPLKQGLKHKAALKATKTAATFRSSSIKTRIETGCGRQRSAENPLSDHLPLKQGLKLRESSRS